MLKLTLILIATLALMACSVDDTDEIVGVWKATLGGVLGVLSFDNNGRCTISYEGETVGGTYLVDGNFLETNFDGEISSFTFSISRNLMTLKDNDSGDIVIFERS